MWHRIVAQLFLLVNLRLATSFVPNTRVSRCSNGFYQSPLSLHLKPHVNSNIFVSKACSTKGLHMTATTADETDSPSEGKATMSDLIFNLIKSIVGAGVLSLPAGIAAFGDAPSAVIPASFLIASIGGLSAYGFSLIGRVCYYTGTNSYRDAWSESISKKTSIIPAASCTFKVSTFIILLVFFHVGQTSAYM